ncbi:Homeodomain-like superfamily protein [Euphorbia peplus]|nr:Homeodomain-like superfamily protein [Euphorbia peplus]
MFSGTDLDISDYAHQDSDDLEFVNAGSSLSDLYGYSKEFEHQLLLEAQPDDDFKITSLLYESDSDNAFIQNSNMLFPHNLVPSQHTSVTQLQDSTPVIQARNDESDFQLSSELQSAILKLVEQLGGIERAIPEDIVFLMNVKGLTVEHVKSQLKSYQYDKCFDPKSSEAFMTASIKQETEG